MTDQWVLLINIFKNRLYWFPCLKEMTNGLSALEKGFIFAAT